MVNILSSIIHKQGRGKMDLKHYPMLTKIRNILKNEKFRKKSGT